MKSWIYAAFAVAGLLAAGTFAATPADPNADLSADPNADPSADDGSSFVDSGNGDANWFDSTLSSLTGAIGLTPNYITTWANAIAQFEGFNNPGSRAQRNNNPGNLEIVGDAGRDAQGFAIFSSASAGMAALVADLEAKVRKYPTYTIYDIMARYAPPSQNNTQQYAAYVANQLGVPISTQIGTLS